MDDGSRSLTIHFPHIPRMTTIHVIYDYYIPEEKGNMILDETVDAYKEIVEKDSKWPYYIIEKTCTFSKEPFMRRMSIDNFNYYVAETLSPLSIIRTPTILSKNKHAIHAISGILIPSKVNKKEWKSVTYKEFFSL